MEITRETIEAAIEQHLPGRTVCDVRDRGEWVRRIVEITLDGGEIVYLKLHSHSSWMDSTVHEAQVARMLGDHGLPAPRVLAVDPSCTILSYPYLIQERVGGTRLDTLLAIASERDALSIYETLGKLYRRMHHIRAPRSGVWDGSPERVLPVSPNAYMYQAKIVEGSGKRAMEEGRLSRPIYERVVALWAEQMDYLQDHQPCLVHGSPFLWTIYLATEGHGWRVTKLTALGDVLWWDAAYDLAFLRYPPFGSVSPPCWEAFATGYGPLPEPRRLLLYAILQRLCAAIGAYMEPQIPRNRTWRDRCLADLDGWLDAVERAI